MVKGGGGGSGWEAQQRFEIEGNYVTWGLCHNGDSLFSAADLQYESKIYTVPPPGPPTGCILRTKLGADGVMLASAAFTKV